MIDIDATIIGDLNKLRNLSARSELSAMRAMEGAVDLLYEKVIENLSGKILQVKTGELRGSIKTEPPIRVGSELVAFIGPNPASPKAQALEFGGKGDYVIHVGAKGVLANAETGFFSKHDVIHPPSKAYAYLRTAVDEARVEITRKFISVFETEL